MILFLKEGSIMDRSYTPKRGLKVTVLAVLLFVFLLQTAMAGSISCRINENTKVYSKASKNAQSMKVPKNTTVTMVAWNGSWATVQRGNAKAYIPLKYLTFTNPIRAYAKNGAKLYKNASSSSGTICGLASGTVLYVTGGDGSYYRVQNSGGSVKGWVKYSYVAWSAPSKVLNSPSGSGVSTKTSKLLAFAQSQLGKPYARNCREPASYDCSHFVSYCFKQVGISVPKAAKYLGYSKSLRRISNIAELRIGDILVFNTDPADGDLSDHVAIYIGNGKFVHASYTAGKVIVSSFTSYYKKAFSWGLRTSI